MAVAVCRCVFLVVALFAIAHAYFPVRPPPPTCFGGMRYDSSCRESIEDLKALVEVTQSFKPDNNNYTCPTCANCFSEEIMLKLVNALIFIATSKCGYNVGDSGGQYLGGGGKPGGVNPDGTGWATNVGGNAGGGPIGGGNTGVVIPGETGGGNSGVVNPSGTEGGNSGVVNPSGTGGGSSTGGGHTGAGNSGKKDPLIDLSALDGSELLGLGVGGNKVLGVNVGGSSGGSDGSSSSGSSTNNGGKNGDALIDLGLLNKDSVANLGLGGNPVLNVAVGKKGDGENEE